VGAGDPDPGAKAEYRDRLGRAGIDDPAQRLRGDNRSPGLSGRLTGTRYTAAMARPVTLFTGQWADLPLEVMAAEAASMGYDGLELACWGDHFEVAKAASDGAYCRSRLAVLEKHKLKCYAISSHLVGQAVCDPIERRHRVILPEAVWGDGEPEGVRGRAAEEMKRTARAAAKLGVKTVNGFTGSSIWHKVYGFPPVSEAEVADGFDDFARRWGPILDEFKNAGVRFALEVHPSEIAFDYYTAERALEAVGGHPAFGFNFDPSHLLWQGVAPNKFIERFADRIFHVHMKDVAVHYGPGNHRGGDGLSGALGSHLPFGDVRRGWDFRSVGRGHVSWEAVIRALNRIGYSGPLSVEWEDRGMDRKQGARESCAFVKRLDFAPSAEAFDAAFKRE
jgi:sugar phosphate isomerase/epimerase